MGAQQAYADTLVPTGDTYVKIDNSGPYGAESDIVVKQSGGGSGSTVRKGLLEFSIENAKKVDDATLLLDVSSFNDTAGATSATFTVWGIIEAAPLPLPAVENLKYNGVCQSTGFGSCIPILAADSNGINDNSPAIFDADFLAAGKQSLGSFTISSADLSKTIAFESQELKAFIKSQPERSPSRTSRVILLITRDTNSGSLNTAFASNEHTTLNGPRLQVSSHKALTPAADTFVTSASPNSANGPAAGMAVKKVLSDTRVGAIKFNMPENTARDVREASLALDVNLYSYPNVPETTFWVWGIPDGKAHEDFSENNLTYSNLLYLPIFNEAGYLDTSSDSVFNQKLEPLGTFTVHNTDVNKTVYFTSVELVDFINADTNGKIAVLLTRPDAAGLSTQFATKENPSFHPPTLNLEFAHSDSDAAPDYSLIYKDVDGDVHRDLLLVISNPGGDGQIIADPLIIAEFTRYLGHSFGSGLEYWNALSASQKQYLLMEIDAINPSASADDLINATELNTVLSSLPRTRVYTMITPFNGSVEQGLNSVHFDFDLDEANYAVECALGQTTAEVDSLQSNLFFTADGSLVLGAQNSMLGFTGSLGKPAGSLVDASVGLGTSFWTGVSAGSNDLLGFSNSVSLDPITVQLSVYVKGSDAADIFYMTAWACTNGWDGAQIGLTTLWLDYKDWHQEFWTVVSDKGKNYFMVARSWFNSNLNSGIMTANIWVGNAQETAMVWLSGASSVVVSEVSYGISIGNDAILNGYDTATDELIDWGTSSATTLSSAYDSAEGWVAGAGSDVEDLGNDIGDAVGDAVDSCGCTCKPSCWGI